MLTPQTRWNAASEHCSWRLCQWSLYSCGLGTWCLEDARDESCCVVENSHRLRDNRTTFVKNQSELVVTWTTMPVAPSDWLDIDTYYRQEISNYIKVKQTLSPSSRTSQFAEAVKNISRARFTVSQIYCHLWSTSIRFLTRTNELAYRSENSD